MPCAGATPQRRHPNQGAHVEAVQVPLGNGHGGRRRPVRGAVQREQAHHPAQSLHRAQGCGDGRATRRSLQGAWVGWRRTGACVPVCVCVCICVCDRATPPGVFNKCALECTQLCESRGQSVAHKPAEAATAATVHFPKRSTATHMRIHRGNTAHTIAYPHAGHSMTWCTVTHAHGTSMSALATRNTPMAQSRGVRPSTSTTEADAPLSSSTVAASSYAAFQCRGRGSAQQWHTSNTQQPLSALRNELQGTGIAEQSRALLQCIEKAQHIEEVLQMSQ